MNERQAMMLMRQKGIVFDGAKGLITPENFDRLAQDAAMATPPTAGVPAVLTTYVDPAVIEVLTAPTNAREIFGEVKKGDWSDTGALFKAVEMVGQTTPYTDFGNGATADVNVSYPYRENYVFQTHVRYGDREVAVSGRALINLASEKQLSAATVLDIDANRFYLLGVSGKQIYGLLNDPNIPAAITPTALDESGKPTLGGSVTKWDAKNTRHIYEDILKLASELFTNSRGNIDEKSPLVLCVSPAVNVLLGKATDYNISVKDMLTKYFADIRFVTLPELADGGEGDRVALIATAVKGRATAQLGFSDKMRALRIVAHTSWYDQKFVAGTYGAIVYYPYAIAVMTGVAGGEG